MAIVHYSTILCDYLIRSDEGRLSYIGTFSNITGPQLPIIKDSLGVSVEFAGTAGDPFQVVVEGPEFFAEIDTGIFPELERTTDFEQFTLAIAGQLRIVFETEGVYSVIVRSGDLEVSRYPFGVRIVPTEDGVGNV